MTHFSDEFLANFRIERNELFLSENRFSTAKNQGVIQDDSANNNGDDQGNDYMRNLFNEMEKKEAMNEIEKNFLDEKLRKIETKKIVLEEKKMSQLKEKEKQDRMMQEVFDSKQLLFNDIRKYSKQKSDFEIERDHSKFEALLQKVSDFSQQMFVDIAQCRMMTNQVFQKLDYLSQINASFASQQRLEFQCELENINAQNNFAIFGKQGQSFIQQTRKKLKELQDKRIEAKKSIENA